MPIANSMTSMPRWMSPLESGTVLPCSMRQQLGELVGIGVDQLDELHHDPGAALRVPRGPLLLCLHRRGHRGVDVGGRRQQDLGLHLAGAGIEHVGGAGRLFRLLRLPSMKCGIGVLMGCPSDIKSASGLLGHPSKCGEEWQAAGRLGCRSVVGTDRSPRRRSLPCARGRSAGRFWRQAGRGVAGFKGSSTFRRTLGSCRAYCTESMVTADLWAQRHAATLSRRESPESSVNAGVAAVATSAGPAGAAPDFFVAGLDRFVQLLRAVCLRRDRRELGSAVFGERGIVLL